MIHFDAKKTPLPLGSESGGMVWHFEGFSDLLNYEASALDGRTMRDVGAFATDWPEAPLFIRPAKKAGAGCYIRPSKTLPYL
jgi:hypothetical protein